MDDQLADILEQCLERIGRGATVDECLAAHPAAQAELELPLRMAVQLGGLPRPAMPAAARAALETRMVQLAAERRLGQSPIKASANGAGHTVPAGRPPWRTIDPSAALLAMLRALGYRGTPNQPWLRLAALAVAIVLVLMVSTGAVLATQAVINSIRTQPTTVPTAAPTAMSLTFDGPIQQLAQERWVVGGRTILLDPQTAIRGIPSLGMLARIHGTLGAGGALLADSITIEAPTVLPTATFVPPAPATATPAPPIAPTTTPAPAAPAPQVTAQPPAPQPGDDNHVCQGQQRGRDDKKCDPKPHDNKPPGGKHDDKPKDKGPHK